MEREDLERELVTKDKQSVITDCLNLFDVNASLVAVNTEYKKRIDGLVNENKALSATINNRDTQTRGAGLRSWFKKKLKI